MCSLRSAKPQMEPAAARRFYARYGYNTRLSDRRSASRISACSYRAEKRRGIVSPSADGSRFVREHVRPAATRGGYKRDSRRGLVRFGQAASGKSRTDPKRRKTERTVFSAFIRSQ